LNLGALVLAAAALGGGAASAPPFRPSYELPAPGSYRLPVVQRVGDHALLDERGSATTLFSVKGKNLAVVSFI
jgi:hypothetical protein